MKKTAIFTMVRNEPYFLPRWVEYYSRVEGASIHVLDHESCDGSTDRLPAHVTRKVVCHPEAERALWMLRTVQDYWLELLRAGFERVVFVEVDEFLIPDPQKWASFGHFLHTHNDFWIGAKGWNVVPQPGNEPLPATGPMLKGRRWKRCDFYDMRLIGSGVPNWRIGRHGLEDAPNDPDVGLRLVHLHYADRELGWKRIWDRRIGKVPAPDGMGYQNKYDNRQDFDSHWHQICYGGEEDIPEAYWSIV